MTEETALKGIFNTTSTSEERQRRILQQIAQEVKLAIDGARNMATEEAKKEAAGIVYEARRKAEEIVLTAKQEAERIISETKRRAQAKLEDTERHQGISGTPPRGLPPPFVDTETDRTNYRRMPVFWA